jgi:hypothetical protein
MAKFLNVIGYYIGSDLNEASDNLWFTLLFKKLSVVSRDLAYARYEEFWTSQSHSPRLEIKFIE